MVLRRVLSMALMVTLVLVVTDWSAAKAPQPNPAMQLLLQAQGQFQNQDYAAARDSLWKAYRQRESLAIQQRKVLSERLRETEEALEGQLIAKSLMATAQKAMAAKNWSAAQAGFAKAAVSPYLAADARTQAKQQLAIVETQVAAADDAMPAAPTTKKLATSPAKVPVQPAGSSHSDVTGLQKVKVDKCIADGNDAMNKNRPAEAIKCYERALALDPDNQTARNLLNSARLQTAQPGTTAILPDMVRKDALRRQVTLHDINKALQRSHEKMAGPLGEELKADMVKKDFDEAENAAKTALSILVNNKHLFSVNAYRTQQNKIKERISWIQKKREKWEIERVRGIKTKIDDDARKAALKKKLERKRTIAEMTQQVRTLQKQRKYRDALNVLQQIHDMDPNIDWVEQNLYMLRDFILLDRQREQKRDKYHELGKLSASIQNSFIPWYDKIRYPKDWVELTARRAQYEAGAATDSEENRRTQQKLNTRLGKVPLEDIRFEDAITYIREQTGVNIYVNWKALEVELEGIRDQKINVMLSDVPAETVLEKILEDAGGSDIKLGYVITAGVININTQEQLNELTYPRVYDIRDLLARVPNFIGPRVDLESIGEDTGSTNVNDGGSGGGGGGGGIFDDEGDDDRPEDKEDDLISRSEMVKKIKDLITNTVERDSWYPNGMAAINELNGNLVITQTAKNHREVRNLIDKLRESRTIQISIEARFITVTTGFLSQIGVDLDVYFNIGSNIAAPGAYEAGPTGATAPLYGIDPVDGTAYPFGPPLGWASTTTDPSTGARVPVVGPNSTWNGAGARASRQLKNFSPIGVTNSSNVFANVTGVQTNVVGGIGTLVGAGNSAMSIAGTFLDDIQVDFLIEATQAHSQTRMLTAPRITLFNGQRSYMSVATQQAYVAGLDPIVADNVAAFRPLIRYAPSGTMLDVDATVSHDRRYVTMTLRPQVVTLNLSNAAGNVGGIDYVDAGGMSVGLPNITLQDVQTTVSVPDRGTLLIGGMKLAGEVEREMGVPVLSQMPVVNRAFTNKGKLRDEHTLLILVKPTILIQDELELDPNIHVEESSYEHGFEN